MRRAVLVALAGFTPFTFAANGPGCEPGLAGSGVTRAEALRHTLAWKPDRPIAVGRAFELAIAVCAHSGARVPRELRIDATMPEHGHGMNYRPRLRLERPGRWRAQGLLFHMPGRWEIRFEWRDGERRESLSQVVTIE